MRPKIGINTLSFDTEFWYRQAKNSEFRVLEINMPTVGFRFDDKWLEKVRGHLQGFDLSMHSETYFIFSGNEQFTRTHLSMLKSEILACEILGVKELVFHLKDEKLSEAEADQYKEIVDYAKQHGVALLYESNYNASMEVTLDFLKRFPEVNYNFDLGHIHYAYCNGSLGCGINEFIAKVKDRTVHMHAHNNDGTDDQHRALRDGKLDWRHVLDQLDMTKLRKIIMELKTKEDIKKTKEDLDDYFKKTL